MPDKAAVFEETYRHYLGRIADLDLTSRAARLGAETDGDDLLIQLYGSTYRLTHQGVFNSSGASAGGDINTTCMAAWLAPPPIQLPATVLRPRHSASGPSTPIISGEI